MPHMMPMLWMFIFMSSFLFLFILSTLIYFFYMPYIPKNSQTNNIKLYKWNWTW